MGKTTDHVVSERQLSYRNAIDLLTIAARAASMRGVSLKEIEETLGRDYRTAQRVVAALAQLYPELERLRDEETGGARWRLPRTALAPLLTPTADELAALSLAEEALSLSGGVDHVQALRSLHGKILALIPKERSRRIEADEEALLLALGHAKRPGPRPVGMEAIDLSISTALKGGSQLRIRYRGWYDEAARERTVAPHGLLLGTRRYLVAVDAAKPSAGIRHYRVDGIEEATVLPIAAERLAGFDLEVHALTGFGSYHDDGGIHDVEWRFAPRAARWVEGFSFHPTQTIVREDGGTVLVRFRAAGLLEMCWHLYMWGDAVEVVRPPELAEMVAEHRRADFPALP